MNNLYGDSNAIERILYESDLSDFEESDESEDDFYNSDSRSSESENEEDIWENYCCSSCPNFQKNITFIHQNPKPLDNFKNTPQFFFNLLINEEVINLIVNETNRYAMQKMANSQWIPVTPNDIKIFLGLLLWMGLCKRSSIRSYWSRDFIFQNNVSKVMSRNRFENILRYLHFADNDGTLSAASTRIHKFQQLQDLLECNFKASYTVGKRLVIDETMVPFRGRLSFRQYIPNKRHRYGIKLFKLCSPEGYLLKSVVYVGKMDKLAGVELSENVVLSLMAEYLGAGRVLYCDNFYTSIPRAKTLLDNATHLVGTLRRNRRNIPTNFLRSKVEKGSMLVQQNRLGITIYRWIDKREVLLLSAYHDVDMTVYKNKRGQDKVKPLAIYDYNNNKMGIDLNDQLASYGTVQRKSVKWYRKVALELLLNVSIVNSFILYKQYTGKKISVTKFRELICSYLLDNTNDAVKPRKLKHVLSKGKRSNCTAYYKRFRIDGKSRTEANALAKKVFTRCDQCIGNSAICLPCFNNSHK